MTDANLMDAGCVHGNIWYECLFCEQITNLEMEIVKLRDFTRRVTDELSKYVWDDQREKRNSVVTLLNEYRQGKQPLGYKIRRIDGVEYGPFETYDEAMIWYGSGTGKELITIYQ